MRYLIIFLISLAFINISERIMLPSTNDGVHLQGWTSNTMMQALPIKTLRETPLQSLWYLHKQPPMLDGIRAILAQFVVYTTDDKLLKDVDTLMYIVWSFFFSGMVTLIYFWMKCLTNNRWGIIAALVWMLHPAPIFYATLLESTFISSFFVLWFFYELWKIGTDGGSILKLACCCIFLFYTRNFFQWYFFPLMIFILFLLGVTQRRIIICMTIIFIFITPLLIKQYILFKTFTTTTFDGYTKSSVIWYNPNPEKLELIKKSFKIKYPAEATKYSGGDRYNSEEQFRNNLIYANFVNEQFKNAPIETLKQVFKSLKLNSSVYWNASSKYSLKYSPSLLADNLPWRNPYNKIFSGYFFISLLLISLILYFFSKSKISMLLQGKKTIALIIPLAYMFFVSHLCNNFDHTESDRMKFILEPLFFIFIFSQIYIYFCGTKNLNQQKAEC